MGHWGEILADWKNKLYFGDNLDWLRETHEFPDESVDLIYLDPPFNSKANYNKIFNEPGGKQSQAQIRAFDDTWDWDGPSSGEALELLARSGENDAVTLIEWLARRADATSKGMAAYLSMMGIRLRELRRVLKSTGSIYLHCDTSASHYLKVLMDCLFGVDQFRSEIIWRRTGAHGKARRYAPVHDVLLFYSKTNRYRWFAPVRPYMKGHVDQYFVQDSKGWRTNYYGNVLTGSGIRTGESGKPWKGFDPTAKGRHWAIPGAVVADVGEDFSSMTQHEKLDRLFELGLIKILPGQAWPIYEHYITPADGQAVSDIWAYQPYTNNTVFGTSDGVDADARWLTPQDRERLGYPTQKPIGLLERVLKASSQEGDLVPDPFCGCGTAIIAAQKLNRRWQGIDITYLAIDLVEDRLTREFPASSKETFSVEGDPKDQESARRLWGRNAKQFEIWAIHLVGAHARDHDGGVDGLYTLIEGTRKRQVAKVVVQVKGGKHLNPGMVRDLIGTVKNEAAAMGLLLLLEQPTPGMRELAAHSGFYKSPVSGQDYPVIQMLTMKEWFEGKRFNLPPGGVSPG